MEWKSHQHALKAGDSQPNPREMEDLTITSIGEGGGEGREEVEEEEESSSHTRDFPQGREGASEESNDSECNYWPSSFSNKTWQIQSL